MIGSIFGAIFSFIFLVIFYCLKFLVYVIVFLIFALWKHQGAILYQRHAPSRRRQIAYNPFPRVRNPQYYKFDFDDFFVKTRDSILIHCWLIRHTNALECPTIICFHGNAGNIGYRLPNAYYMVKELQSNIVMVDYRGYGNSEGVPTEKGLSYDAESILSHLLERNDINLQKVFIFGRSLGGAVAIDLAWRCCTSRLCTVDNDKVTLTDTKVDMNELYNTQINNNNSTNNEPSISSSNDDETATLKQTTRKDEDLNMNIDGNTPTIHINGLIIENTFTSILDMVFVIIGDFLKSRNNQNNENEENSNMSGADNENNNENNENDKELWDGSRFLKYLRLFLKYFITNRWDSLRKVSEITLPTLYLSGLSDELIPPKHMRKLFGNAKKVSVLPVMQTFKDGDHNSTWQRAGQKYWDDIFAFMTSAGYMAQHSRAK